MTWSKSWRIFASITTRVVRILRLTATHHQKSLAKPLITNQISAISVGNLIAAGYTSCLWLLKLGIRHRHGPHYSAAELHNLIKAANSVTDEKSRTDDFGQ
jgi:hypothetical protein